MSLGAFAGGVVKGYQAINDTINTNKRTAIAEQDQALRLRASDREETRYKREQTEWEKKDALEKELANNVNAVFGKVATPDTTETLVGPLDAKDARAGTMDGVQTQVNVPGQPATGAGGMQGVNLMDPKNHGLLLKLESMNMASRLKYGQVKPEEVRQLQAWGKKMEEDGMSQAFGRFMMGDTAALDEVAKKNGVKQYSTFFGKDEDGYPGLMFKIEKDDGTVQTIPATIVAAGLGATGFVNTLDKMEDNATNRFKAEALAGYYGTQGQAALERNDILADGQDARLKDQSRRTDAYVGTQGALARKADRYVPGSKSGSGKGETGPTYDPKLIPDMVAKIPMTMPQLGKPQPGQTPKREKDTNGMSIAARVGNRYHSQGMDPVKAEGIGRSVVERAGAAALKELGPKVTESDFLRRRQELVTEALKTLDKQHKAEPKPAAAPARSSAFPSVSPAEQKARDTDKVGILREERKAEEARLAALKEKPQQTKEYADAVARTEKNLEALDRELGNAAKTASAIRTR